MILKQGDVFTTEAYYIGHGVNVDGVMGAGVAKTVRDDFPTVYNHYKHHCDHAAQTGRRLVGSVFPVKEKSKNKMILNMFTQDRPGPNATYEWVFEAFLRAARGVDGLNKLPRDHAKVIAVPQIGCGIGGLEWTGVEKIIQAVETIVPNVQFEVWEYKP